MNVLFVSSKESPDLYLVKGYTYHFDYSLLADQNKSFILTTDTTGENPLSSGDGVEIDITSTILSFDVPNNYHNETIYYKHSGSSYSGNKIQIIDESFNLQELGSDSNITISALHDIRLKANFSRIPVTLSFESSEGGSLIYNSRINYFAGEQLYISAEPEPHWKFVKWGRRKFGTQQNYKSSRNKYGHNGRFCKRSV